MTNELRKAFKNFHFLQRPSPRTGLNPLVGLVEGEEAVVIFPDGCAVGRGLPSIWIHYDGPSFSSLGATGGEP